MTSKIAADEVFPYSRIDSQDQRVDSRISPRRVSIPESMRAPPGCSSHAPTSAAGKPLRASNRAEAASTAGGKRVASSRLRTG